MIDTRAAFTSLINDPRLDAMLSDAQSKIAAYAPDEQPGSVAAIEKAASVVEEQAAQVRAQLVEEIQEKIALRQEKVAIAVHMFKVASRLSA